MGRNDKCFCGSGKKTKKCHDFNDKSHAAELLKFYNDVSHRIEEHYSMNDTEARCKKGCYECCFDNFTISDIEFDIILLELKRWDTNRISALKERVKNDWYHFKRQYPLQAENYEKDGTGNDEVVSRHTRYMPSKLDIPCIFLGEDGACEVYNSRPYICRRFGVAKMLNSDGSMTPHKVCNVIGNSVEASEWQAEIEDLEDRYVRFNVIRNNKMKVCINKRKYPIIYFLYMAFYKYDRGLSIKDYDDKFSIAKQVYDTQVFNDIIR